MANIFDTAKYILNTIGEVSTMKLQKLCYYAQAISLAETGRPIFKEDFQAWANGPVSRDLFNLHKGKFVIEKSYIPNSLLSGNLTAENISSINKCLDEYGDKEGYELSDMSHSEQPWISARGNIPEGQNCSRKISRKVIREFYREQRA